MPKRSELTVLAVGGHSLIDPDLEPTVENQFDVTVAAMGPVADLVCGGTPMVITHGNGPQVGFMQRRSELAAGELPEVPLDSLVADSQGAIGYMIERSLRSELKRREHDDPVVTILTEVEVSASDPAFAAPDKPIGRFYSEPEAQDLVRERGWRMMTDPKRGVRRVVASPEPVRIVELSTIAQLVDLGATVICCGGGGIAVAQTPDGRTVGVEAVIDKDRVSALLAIELGASRFVITTSTDRVYSGFYGPEPVGHSRLTLDSARRLANDGEFPAGSMGPKIEAVITYLEAIDGEAVICQPHDLIDALAGRAGTTIARTSAGPGDDQAIPTNRGSSWK